MWCTNIKQAKGNWLIKKNVKKFEYNCATVQQAMIWTCMVTLHYNFLWALSIVSQQPCVKSFYVRT